MRDGKVALRKGRFPAGQSQEFAGDGEVGFRSCLPGNRKGRSRSFLKRLSGPSQVFIHKEPQFEKKTATTTRKNYSCTDRIDLKILKREKFCSPQTSP